MQAHCASVSHLAPPLSATLANTPRNVGRILPGQFGQWFCSPFSDPLGQHGAWTQRYQGRERPAVSPGPFLRAGQGERQLDLPLPPLGTSLAEISSFCPQPAGGTGCSRRTRFSFLFWHLSFTYLHPRCVPGDTLLRRECVLGNWPPKLHMALSSCAALLCWCWPARLASGSPADPVLGGECGRQYCPWETTEMSKILQAEATGAERVALRSRVSRR